MKKWLFILLALVVIAGIGGGAAWKMRDTGPTGIEVEVEPAKRTRIVQTVTATGRIQPMTQVNISADVSAKITRLPVEEGDRIERGTFLVELDRERYLASVESSQASLRVSQSNANVARENMTKAEKDLVRSRDLYEAELEPEAQLDAMVASYEAQKARHAAALDQVEQARANLKQLQDDLSKTQIYSPMTGTISQLNKEVGEIALGSQFQEDVILVISNLEGMEAQVQVDENDIVSVAIGDAATIEVDALPDVVLNGRVTEVANTATLTGSGTTDQKTEFEVTITITDPHPQLRPGMTASVDIVTDVREDALGVPIQAVAVRTAEQLAEGADDDKAWEPDKDGFVELVFVINGNTAEARAVKTGIQSDTQIEVTEGLKEGESIVIGNYRAISRDLEDGAEVLLPSAEAAASGDAG